jgi:hypothetical protein
MRNSYAKALRVKPQSIVPDKRGKTYREHLNDTIREGVPDWADDLLNKLD